MRRDDPTTAFVECVSCGGELDLGRGTDREAAREAKRCGWTVIGVDGADATRCAACRYAGRTDTRALDEGRIGQPRAGFLASFRVHP